MARLLMKLRLVPDDELAEVTELLDSHELDYYLTTAGMFNISMPGIWLVDESKLDQARALLEEYAQQRQSRARELQAAMQEAGKQRTFVDMLLENPLKIFCYLMFALVLIYFSIAPFLNLD